MTVVRVLTNWYDKDDLELAAKARHIVSSMTGNAHFPTPDPTLASISTLEAEFSQAIDDANDGTEAERGVRDEKRAELELQLLLLGNYVQFASKNNRAIALTSGFDLNKEENAPLPPVKVPEGVKASDTGNSGEILVSFKKDPAARSYLVLWAISPQSDNDYQIVTTTTTKAVISGLPRASIVTIKVAAIGSKGQRMTSQPITRVVQ